MENVYKKRRLLPGLRTRDRGQAPLEIGCQRQPSDTRGVLSLMGQASLEMTVSLICVFILMFGALNVFLWVNKQMVQRQEYYEHAPGDAAVNGTKYGGKYDYGRVEAGDFDGKRDGELVNETKTFYQKLDIFGTRQ